MNFIYQAYLADTTICDKMIAHHVASPNRRVGVVSRNGVNVVDKAYKDSTDSSLDEVIAQQYFSQLAVHIRAYREMYPMSGLCAEWVLDQVPAIQSYEPGGGYFSWHCERNTGANPLIANRHLVYMTYLNDVTDGGETEFYHQELKVQPRKGLTLIWPVDWTHTHRGLTSPTQEKYIATGWLRVA